MENENEENENKIMLGDFNCTIDKMDKYDGNKIQTLQMLFLLCPQKE